MEYYTMKTKFKSILKKNKTHLSITISIDGNKIKHNLQRVYPDGRGSYDDVIKNIPLWLSQFPNGETKATFASEDLPYLKDSIIHLWERGIKRVPANIVFEDVWKNGDTKIFESQLIELADYIIENKIFLDPQYSVTFFDPDLGLPLTQESRDHNFCGTGKMLAIDCRGKFFPCIRFTDFSMSKKKKGLSIGDVNNGVSKNKIKPFEELTVAKVSPKECEQCNVASGCVSCVGFCYDESKDHSIFQRTTYNCEMHKANARAVDYFWNKVPISDDINPRKLLIKSIKDGFEKYLLIYTSDLSSSHCMYSNKKADKACCMDNETIIKSINFAQKNNMTPIIIGKLPQGLNGNYMNIDSCEKSRDFNGILVLTSKNILKNIVSKICILHVSSDKLKNLCDTIKNIFYAHKAERINIVLNDIQNFSTQIQILYEKQLSLLVDFIFNHLDSANSLNVFDSAYTSSKKISCDCGVATFSVAPNGKLYFCPGLYFYNEELSIGSLETGFAFSSEILNNFKKRNFRCIYLNKKMTNEYTLEPDILKRIENIELRMANRLKGLLKNEENLRRKEIESL